MHRWSSGRMVACHATDPGPIPGRRTFYFFFSFVSIDYTHFKIYSKSNPKRIHNKQILKDSFYNNHKIMNLVEDEIYDIQVRKLMKNEILLNNLELEKGND